MKKRAKKKKEDEEQKEDQENGNEDEKDEKIQKGPTDLYSRQELLRFLKSLAKTTSGTDGRVNIGMVGYPNVGKSSTINVLCGAKKVSVSATPGKTKHFQTILIGNDVCVCDCPGLVFPTFMSTKADLVINGILPIDQILTNDHLAPVNLVCRRISPFQFLNLYGLTIAPSSGFNYIRPEQLLNAHAVMRGFYGNHGVPNVHQSARIILKDFVLGKLLYCHPPPQLSPQERKVFAQSFNTKTPSTSSSSTSTSTSSASSTSSSSSSSTSSSTTASQSISTENSASNEEIEVLPVTVSKTKEQRAKKIFSSTAKEEQDTILAQIDDPNFDPTPQPKLTSRDRNRARKHQVRQRKRTAVIPQHGVTKAISEGGVRATGHRQTVPGGAGRQKISYRSQQQQPT